MTTQHTPAPWHFSGDSLTHRQFDIYAPAQAPQQHVCTVNNLSAEKLAARDAGVALANARLIAAAPDLLAVLQQANAWVSQYHGVNGHDAASRQMSNVIRTAIERATGGAT